MDIKREAAEALKAMEQNDGLFLGYFCEWLTLNRAIANAGGISPIESASVIATSVERFVSQRLPQADFRTRHSIYWEMTKAAWELGYPQRLFKLELGFSRTLASENGS